MDASLKVAFFTLGCKLNYAETSTIERVFNANGFEKVDFRSGADVIVINTCMVTAAAEKKCRNIISKATRLSPEAYVVVVGCYSQLKAEEILKIPGVDLVLGSREKFKIFEYAGKFRKGIRPVVESSGLAGDSSFDPSWSVSERTRSFLKIQDGCDYFCSYCTIPYTRGESRSPDRDQIVKQASEIEKSGVGEIVLTGVNIGDFGRKKSDSLYHLLTHLLEHTGVERYRLSSIEPELLTDQIIELAKTTKRVAPHFHLPLQSGCDRILKMMNRRYGRDLFAGRVKKIRSVLPRAGIGVDVITGFPGETEKDFDETFSFLSEAKISYLHVFTYSARENTKASLLADTVSHAEKERRSRILHNLSEVKKERFLRASVDQLHRVLFESINKKGRMYGFTGNYIRVEVAADEALVKRFADVKLLGLAEDGNMKGVVIN